ncbi:MurR/RpiR family transcriptional regulator [Clostridium sp. BJN0001]|uniref:MurR/RpiR family transcriptional regulator n=1 Tax=Clostridium sp. BJN0001 TaxID=2930219 RepID=UPI001FD4EFA7|nr:MurR/RpiR family transcriptional regulator [Clostridium sp. BJN0001]
MLLDKMNEKNLFNQTEQAISEYLIKNIDNIDDLTIHKLAKETFTSNTTIIRFCHKLNFSGFKDMKIQLIKELENSYKFHNNINYNLPFKESDSVKDITLKLAELSKEIIDLSSIELNQKDLQNALVKINEAERIFIFGKGDSYISALYFANNMKRINKYIILADTLHSSASNVLNIRKKDVAIFLTYSGNHYDYTKYSILLRKKGIFSILITSAKKSILTNIVNLTLFIPNRESIDSKIAPFSSELSFTYILNIIYSYIFKENYYINYENTKKKEKNSQEILKNNK